MALGEYVIDFVIRLSAITGRTAGPQRRCEFRRFRLLPFHPPAGEASRLARQIIERQLEGLKPACKALRIDEAIGRRGGIGHGPGRRPQGCYPGIASEEMDARGTSSECPAALPREIFSRIEQLK